MSDETQPSPAEVVALADRSPLPQLGTMLKGKYRLDRVLGEGGFGRVYQGTELLTGRAVAVKVLKGAHGKLAERFKREARAIARLESPRTLTLYDYGDIDGTIFMVTEYIDGEDLAERLARGPLTEPELVHVLTQVLESLAEAHAKNILHRDIKPANIRLYEFGGKLCVKVLDFGLAMTLAADEDRLTGTGSVIGTPKYMSPEQITGEKLGPTTDVFSLGVVAIEALLGADDPLVADIGQRLLGIRLESEHGVSAGLRDVINRMVQADPLTRYPSASSVARDLQRLANIEHAQTKPLKPAQVSAPPRMVAPEASRAVPWGLVLVGLLGLTGAGIAWFSLTANDEPAPVPVRAAPSQLLIVKPAEPTKPVGSPAKTQPTSNCSLPFRGSGYLQERHNLFDAARWYTYIPESLDETQRHPLIVLFHQQGHTGEIFLDQGGFRAVADRLGAIVLAPSEPDFNAWSPRTEHIPKVLAMLEEVNEQLCVDPGRTIAVGHGSGAGMIQKLACEGGPVGAVVTHSYSIGTDYDVCPEWKVPYLMMYPTKSGYEPVEGGTTCSGAKRASQAFHEGLVRKRLGCSDEKNVLLEDDGSSCWSHGCEVASFEVCEINGGHSWTGTEIRNRIYRVHDCDGPTPTFAMAEQVGDFFERTLLKAE